MIFVLGPLNCLQREREELAHTERTREEKTKKVYGERVTKGEDDIKEEALNVEMDGVH